jgi:hypothetical protein
MWIELDTVPSLTAPPVIDWVLAPGPGRYAGPKPTQPNMAQIDQRVVGTPERLMLMLPVRSTFCS